MAYKFLAQKTGDDAIDNELKEIENMDLSDLEKEHAEMLDDHFDDFFSEFHDLPGIEEDQTEY